MHPTRNSAALSTYGSSGRVMPGVRLFMDVIPLLQKVIGVFTASTCCAALTAFLFWAPHYADTTSGFLGSARDWSGVAAIMGAVAGCVLGAVIGLVIVLGGAGKLTGGLIGALAMAPVAVWLYTMKGEWTYEVSGMLLFPAGAVVGVVASLPPAWARGARLSSSPLLTTLLAIFVGAPIILLAIAAGVSAVKFFVAYGARRTHQELVATLDKAKVEVFTKNARVISDDGKNVQAEVTLQINNVPPSIPYYEMNVHEVGKSDSYFTGFNRMTNPPIPNPHLRVTRTGGKWVFYDLSTDQTISDDAQNVTLRFEFTRTKADPNELPDTITPRLGIWAREDKVYSDDYRFFYKPIPVSFRGGPDGSNPGQ